MSNSEAKPYAGDEGTHSVSWMFLMQVFESSTMGIAVKHGRQARGRRVVAKWIEPPQPYLILARNFIKKQSI